MANSKKGASGTKKIGRPTVYNDAVQAQADNYITDYATFGHAIPSLCGLAMLLNIAKSTLYKWASDDPDSQFSDTLKKLNSNQEFRLLNGGLLGDFNPTITKLALCNHGYSEKTEAEVNTTTVTPINIILSEAKDKDD